MPIWSPTPSSVSIGLTKSIMSFNSTQIAKSNLFPGDLSTFGEPLRSGLVKLTSPISWKGGSKLEPCETSQKCYEFAMVAGSPGWGRGDSGRARVLIRREIPRSTFNPRGSHLCGAPRGLQGSARDPFDPENRASGACHCSSLGCRPGMTRWNCAPHAGETDL